jgi:RND family efflux transporter MFP subunit
MERQFSTADFQARMQAASPDDRMAQSWSAFAGAASGEEFCSSWLALQCSLLPDVRAGLLLMRDDAVRSYVPAAIWPDRTHDVNYLAKAAQRVVEKGGSVVLEPGPDSAEAAAESVQIAYPVEVDGDLHGVVVLDLKAQAPEKLQAIQRHLLWGAGWLEALLRRRQSARDAAALERAAAGLDLVQAAQEHRRLDRAAMAVVNELAARCKADRVSLGMQQRGTLKLRAISSTAWFDRKTQLVETIENAMEEAMDQEGTVGFPAAPLQGKVVVAQRDLAARAGAAAVLSVPLTAAGRPAGALTLECNQGPGFDADSIALCEAAGALLGPVLQGKLEAERWFGGRIVDGLAAFRDKLVGPRHPALKLGTALAVLVVLFLGFVDGEFRLSAKTAIEGEVQRAAVAPFEGFIAEALVRAGDKVRQGQVLAVLDDRDLRLDHVKWESEKEQAERKHRDALARRDRSATRILAAQLAQAEAQLALTEEKLARTRLVAPFDGVVVAGDLSQMLGAPVEQGKVLFELAPLDSYRVVLKLDERDMSYVAVGQRGELALTGLTGHALAFTVKSVTSVSTPQEGRNFFRVEAQLDNAAAPLRPGMEGVGKIVAGERRLAWIWTRAFVDWLRIALWSWLP